MQVRVALLHGCYLIALEDGQIHVRCEGRLYGADEEVPVGSTDPSGEALTARDFVRQSMQALVGPDEQTWPAPARRFAGPGTA